MQKCPGDISEWEGRVSRAIKQMRKGTFRPLAVGESPSFRKEFFNISTWKKNLQEHNYHEIAENLAEAKQALEPQRLARRVIRALMGILVGSAAVYYLTS